MWVKMEDRCGTTDVNVWFSRTTIQYFEVPNFDPYPYIYICTISEKLQICYVNGKIHYKWPFSIAM